MKKLFMSSFFAFFLLLSNNVFAGGTVTQSTINLIRADVGLVVGFSSHANYVSLVCGGVDPGVGGQCDGPPEAGLVGAFTSFVNQLPTVAKNAGVASCANLPASGTLKGNDANGNSVTLTFATPTHTVPAAWLNGGTTFQHRATFSETVSMGSSSTTLYIAIEFNCGNNQPMYTVISMPVGSNAPGYNRDINMYNGPLDANNNAIEVYFTEHSTSTGLAREAQAYSIVYQPAANSFQMWGVMQGNICGGTNCSWGRSGSAKTYLNGNYSTGVTSVYTDGAYFAQINGDNFNDINTTALSSNLASYATDAIATASDYDFITDITTGSTGTALQNISGNSLWSFVKQGCMNLSSPTTGATSTTLCSGMPLTTAPMAPAIDSTGKYTVKWVTGTMTSKIEHAGP